MSVPNISVDFILDKTCLFLSIKNISSVEATDICVVFNRPIILSHKKNKLGHHALLNELPIFSKLRYLPPDNEIKVFIDAMDPFFMHNKLLVYRLDITFKDLPAKKVFKKVIRHDLSIYKNFPIVLNPK